MKPNFSGWATKNNLRCSDGRTIRKNAFKGNDGQKVPLIWGHKHDGPADVLGHAILKNRDEGVYAYCYLNDSEAGLAAKEIVEHGDVRSLSIYANQLKQIGTGCLQTYWLLLYPWRSRWRRSSPIAKSKLLRWCGIWSPPQSCSALWCPIRLCLGTISSWRLSAGPISSNCK